MTRWQPLDGGVLTDEKRFLLYPLSRKRFFVLDTEGNAKEQTLYPCTGTLTQCKSTVARIKLKEMKT